MRALLTQAGATMQVDSVVPALDRLISEACGAALRPAVNKAPDPDVDIHVVLDGSSAGFSLSGWDPLTRDAFSRDGNVVLHNACGSGFDLRITVLPSTGTVRLRVEARYRPPRRERIAGHVLRSRFHLLARAVLLQYPALWAASTRGRLPVHAAAVQLPDSVALLVGPGGVGRSTLLLAALGRGAVASSDNLCVTDGQVVHGVVEPVRAEAVGGRRMPHGRGETQLPRRVDSLVPDQVIVLRRTCDGPGRVAEISGVRAASALVAGTYMAGELSRYWAFAATLAYGTGHGVAHPPIATVAQALCRLPCTEITLARPPAPALEDLLRTRELVTT
jgi:hypothetical protein